MPKIDMPLEELRHYQGTNPKPHDFDEYWDRQIQIANQFPLSYTLIPVEMGYDTFQCFELWFQAIDNASIYSKLILPAGKQNIPAVLQFHGYPGASRSWFEQLSFAGAGMALAAMDCRGQGGKSEDIGGIKGTTVTGHIVAGLDDDVDQMYYRKVFLDTLILSRIVAQLPEVDNSRIYANGASQGAALALVCASLNSNIKRVSALYPFLSDYQRVWEMGLDQIAYEGLRYYSRWFDEQGTRRQIMFEKLGYIDVQHFVNRIQGEVLFGTGLSDDVCPASTQFAVYHNIKAEKQHLIYPDYSHEQIMDFDNHIIPFLYEGLVK